MLLFIYPKIFCDLRKKKNHETRIYIVNCNVHILFHFHFFCLPKALASATYQPPRLNPITGRKVVVKCSIPNLPPGVSVSWIKNGQPFQPPAGRARLVDNNRRIEFSYVYPEDTGSYTCMATDGSTLSHSTGVNVYKNGKK